MQYCFRKGESDMSETMAGQELSNSSANLEQHAVLNELLKPEVQQSLTALIEQLPKLNELVSILTKSYDFIQAVATDEVLKSDTVGAIQEIMDPVTDTVRNIAVTAIEAKDRAEESNEVIGLFTLLRMMKDPQAQKLFRFINAYLQISRERNRHE